MYVKNLWLRKHLLYQITIVPLLAVEWWKQIWLSVFTRWKLVAWCPYYWLAKPCPELTILTCRQLSHCHWAVLGMTLVVWAKHHCEVKPCLTNISHAQKNLASSFISMRLHVGTAGVATRRTLSKKHRVVHHVSWPNMTKYTQVHIPIIVLTFQLSRQRRK